MKKEITLINGNGNPYNVGIPKIIILNKFNDVAFAHLKENTGIEFERKDNYMVGQPTDFSQITAIFCSYNFMTVYMNNWNEKNTIFLRHMNVTSEHLRGNIYYDGFRGKEILSF